MMKKAIKWIIIFFLAAIISHHPTQIFFAAVVLILITGIAVLIKIVISWTKGDTN